MQCSNINMPTHEGMIKQGGLEEETRWPSQRGHLIDLSFNRWKMEAQHLHNTVIHIQRIWHCVHWILLSLQNLIDMLLLVLKVTMWLELSQTKLRCGSFTHNGSGKATSIMQTLLLAYSLNPSRITLKQGSAFSHDFVGKQSWPNIYRHHIYSTWSSHVPINTIGASKSKKHKQIIFLWKDDAACWSF